MRASRNQGATRGVPQSAGLSSFQTLSLPDVGQVVFPDHKFRLCCRRPKSLAEIPKKNAAPAIARRRHGREDY